jgi:hypothetical protein
MLFADSEERKKQITEEYEKDKAKIRRQYAVQSASEILGLTSTFLNTIADINQQTLELQLAQAKGNENAILAIQKESLERQKKLRIAQVVVSTAESVISAFNVTANIPPPFGQIIGGILAASYVALGVKSIQNINAATIDGAGTVGGGFNNVPGGNSVFGGINLQGGGSAPISPSPFSNTLPGVGGGRLGSAGAGTIAEAPIRAYVLAGDVENGLQANYALNNRRRLAG